MDKKKINLLLAEQLIDAFYSFDAAPLTNALAGAESSIPSIVYYQGWARGGNYKIINRMPCVEENVTKTSSVVTCSITVKDDLMAALGISFDVTDSFKMTIENGVIIEVATSSNDLDVFHDAQRWVQLHHPELIAEPCRDFFNGGPTPDKCVQTMVKGFEMFAASVDFPAGYK